jgi:hypothetical protein
LIAEGTCATSEESAAGGLTGVELDVEPELLLEEVELELLLLLPHPDPASTAPASASATKSFLIKDPPKGWLWN